MNEHNEAELSIYRLDATPQSYTNFNSNQAFTSNPQSPWFNRIQSPYIHSIIVFDVDES
ncbi:MAG: hypothetical protein FWC11_00400 [Firmicutes bacterium]|nr:hypothetical protein [Bacillota bacterium]